MECIFKKVLDVSGFQPNVVQKYSPSSLNFQKKIFPKHLFTKQFWLNGPFEGSTAGPTEFLLFIDILTGGYNKTIILQHAFYKHIVYKNIQAHNDQKIKNI